MCFGGSQAKNTLDKSRGKSIQDAATQATVDPQLQRAIAAYKQSGSLNDSLQGIKGTSAVYTEDARKAMAQRDRKQADGSNQYGADQMNQLEQRINDGTTSQGISDSDLQMAIRNQMYADPETGSMLATDQVRSNPLMSGFLGKGGIQDQRQADEANLTKHAYDWNAMDETALGQAQGNINRQYGAEQGNLARAMASRGFGGADSGVAASQFSGLQGNVSDRMAAAQQSLANNRMQVGMQRLGAARSAVNQAQGIAQGAVTDQYNRNMTGLGRGDKQVANTWAQDSARQDQKNAEWKQQQDSSINPGAIAGSVLSAGVGSMTGGLGAAAGSSLAKGIGLSSPTNQYDPATGKKLF